MISNLSLEEKIGQMFMFGINKNNTDGIIKLIIENKIGGVILYKKNYTSYEEMLDLIKKLREANKQNKIPLCDNIVDIISAYSLIILISFNSEKR